MIAEESCAPNGSNTEGKIRTCGDGPWNGNRHHGRYISMAEPVAKTDQAGNKEQEDSKDGDMIPENKFAR